MTTRTTLTTASSSDLRRNRGQKLYWTGKLHVSLIRKTADIGANDRRSSRSTEDQIAYAQDKPRTGCHRLSNCDGCARS
jgi:hypothetical protein